VGLLQQKTLRKGHDGFELFSVVLYSCYRSVKLLKKYDLITLEEGLSLKRQDILDLYKRYMNPSLATMMGLLGFDKRFVRAEGVRVWDEDGVEYLDFLGGYGALNFGHNDPRLNAALERVNDAPNLLQASLGTLSAVLSHNLAAIMPEGLQRSFFCNSGAESVEGALKLAKAATKKKQVIYCEGAFHGKTMGALSVTGRSKYQAPFAPLVPDCVMVTFGDQESLGRELKKGEAAAVILEPIQGEGGVCIPPSGYLEDARRLCRQHGALMIVDEIQTGFGRTGTIFACEQEKVVPDVICTAKSLGGGVMPVAALTTTAEIWDKAYGGFDRCLLHTSTFGGNTRACAAGITAIQILVEDDLAGKAREQGAYLLERLNQLSERFPNFIKEVRGRGLLVGIEFNPLAGGVLNKVTGGKINQIAHEYLGGLVAGELINNYQIITAYTLNNPNVIRLEPPLIVSREQLDRLLQALQDIFQKYHSLWGLVLASGKRLIKA
jgi:putrescine aminotransferase